MSGSAMSGSTMSGSARGAVDNALTRAPTEQPTTPAAAGAAAPNNGFKGSGLSKEQCLEKWDQFRNGTKQQVYPVLKALLKELHEIVHKPFDVELTLKQAKDIEAKYTAYNEAITNYLEQQYASVPTFLHERMREFLFRTKTQQDLFESYRLGNGQPEFISVSKKRAPAIVLAYYYASEKDKHKKWVALLEKALGMKPSKVFAKFDKEKDTVLAEFQKVQKSYKALQEFEQEKMGDSPSAKEKRRALQTEVVTRYDDYTNKKQQLVDTWSEQYPDAGTVFSQARDALPGVTDMKIADMNVRRLKQDIEYEKFEEEKAKLEVLRKKVQTCAKQRGVDRTTNPDKPMTLALAQRVVAASEAYLAKKEELVKTYSKHPKWQTEIKNDNVFSSANGGPPTYADLLKSEAETVVAEEEEREEHKRRIRDEPVGLLREAVEAQQVELVAVYLSAAAQPPDIQDDTNLKSIQLGKYFQWDGRQPVPKRDKGETKWSLLQDLRPVVERAVELWVNAGRGQQEDNAFLIMKYLLENATPGSANFFSEHHPDVNEWNSKLTTADEGETKAESVGHKSTVLATRTTFLDHVVQSISQRDTKVKEFDPSMQALIDAELIDTLLKSGHRFSPVFPENSRDPLNPQEREREEYREQLRTTWQERVCDRLQLQTLVFAGLDKDGDYLWCMTKEQTTMYFETHRVSKRDAVTTAKGLVTGYDEKTIPANTLLLCRKDEHADKIKTLGGTTLPGSGFLSWIADKTPSMVKNAASVVSGSMKDDYCHVVCAWIPPQAFKVEQASYFGAAGAAAAASYGVLPSMNGAVLADLTRGAAIPVNLAQTLFGNWYTGVPAAAAGVALAIAAYQYRHLWQATDSKHGFIATKSLWHDAGIEAEGTDMEKQYPLKHSFVFDTFFSAYAGGYFGGGTDYIQERMNLNDIDDWELNLYCDMNGELARFAEQIVSAYEVQPGQQADLKFAIKRILDKRRVEAEKQVTEEEISRTKQDTQNQQNRVWAVEVENQEQEQQQNELKALEEELKQLKKKRNALRRLTTDAVYGQDNAKAVAGVDERIAKAEARVKQLGKPDVKLPIAPTGPLTSQAGPGAPLRIAVSVPSRMPARPVRTDFAVRASL